jgi:PAS domain S-box-containing protein
MDNVKNQLEQAHFWSISPSLMCIIDEKGNFVQANPAWKNILGYSEEELIGKSILDFIHPDDIEITRTEARKIFSGAKTVNYENRYRAKDGSYRWTSWNGVLSSSSRIYGVGIDITESKLAEETFKKSEEKYRLLYENMLDGFIIVGMDGFIQEYNNAYKEVLGYPDEELKTITYSDITPEKWHDFEARIVEEEIVKKGYSGIYEKEYRRKDGTVFPIELRTHLIKDVSGQPAGMWGIVRDITERKQAEAEIQTILNRFYRVLSDMPL